MLGAMKHTWSRRAGRALLLMAMAVPVVHLTVAPLTVARAEKLEAPAVTCRVAPAGTKLTVTFQPEVSLRDLATWFHSISCKQVMFASELGDLSTKVSIIGGGAMTLKDATALFGNALLAAGLRSTIKGNTWIVTRDPKAPSCAAATPAVTDKDRLSIGSMADDTRKAYDITTVDETHFKIKRASFDKLLGDSTEMAKGARVVPWMRDGKAEGLKLYAIRPSSIYAALGFSNGDTVATVNGTAMTSAEVALAAYAELRKAKHLEVGVIRRGKPVTLVYDITD